jgi:hypothetical protein
MAVALTTRAKCVIQPPPWMEPPALEEVLRKERESEAEFQARTLPACAVAATLGVVCRVPLRFARCRRECSKLRARVSRRLRMCSAEARAGAY